MHVTDLALVERVAKATISTALKNKDADQEGTQVLRDRKLLLVRLSES